jgi:YHS domain-containing protein/thiol-disulfide isomerase/thioredoxin
MRHCTLAALLLIVPATFLAGQALTPPASPATGRWLTDYAQAKAESRRLNMPLLVHFSAAWCGPCQVMERETLNSPAVLAVFGQDVVGVKLDFDRDRGLADAFRVKSIPADVVVAPDGKILGRHSGKQKSGPYTAALKHWGGQFERPPAQPPAAAQPLMATSAQPFAAGPELQSQPASPQRRVNQPQRLGPPGSAGQPPGQDVTPELPPLIGLDGYSPVQITAHRQWVNGQREFAAIWQGVVYYLTSKEERDLFIASPHKYAPRLLGCDPVSLAESGRAIQGSVECGAFYDSHLYLFENQDSRTRFKRAPEHFLTSRRPVTAANVIGRRLY